MLQLLLYIMLVVLAMNYCVSRHVNVDCSSLNCYAHSMQSSENTKHWICYFYIFNLFTTVTVHELILNSNLEFH